MAQETINHPKKKPFYGTKPTVSLILIIFSAAISCADRAPRAITSSKYALSLIRRRYSSRIGDTVFMMISVNAFLNCWLFEVENSDAISLMGRPEQQLQHHTHHKNRSQITS